MGYLSDFIVTDEVTMGQEAVPTLAIQTGPGMLNRASCWWEEDGRHHCDATDTTRCELPAYATLGAAARNGTV